MSISKEASPRPTQSVIALGPTSWEPGDHRDPLIDHPGGLIGQAVSRRDGPLKVAGAARFAAEFPLSDMVYAALAYGTIAKGLLAELDTGAAERAPGVVLVMTHRNAPSMKAADTLFLEGAKAARGHDVPILQDDQIRWNGQPIAVVLAETQEQADHARSLIRHTYDIAPAVTAFAQAKVHAHPPAPVLGDPRQEIGDAEAAFTAAPHRVDLTYTTPRNNHNVIELHAATLAWNGGRADHPRLHPDRRTRGLVARADLRDQGGAGPRHLSLRGRRVRQQIALGPSDPGGGSVEARRAAGQGHALA